MKSYYVYLVTIYHPDDVFYYVGSHTWNGPAGQLDPNYHGSCSYRYYNKWIQKYPINEEILEVSDKEHVRDSEKKWILKYLTEKGSFLRSSVKECSSWLKQFKYGTCLNGHANTGEQIHTKESYSKMSEWRKSHKEQVSSIIRGFKIKAGKEALQESSRKAMKTMGTEGLKKRTQTRLRNMGTEGCSILTKHAAETRGESFKESAQKGVITRSGTKTLMRRIKLNGVVYDSIVAACNAAGHRTWNSMISQHFCKGETKVTRVDKNKEYVFEVVEVMSSKDYGVK